MAKKKKSAKPAAASNPKSFHGVVRDAAPSVRAIAKALRAVVLEELPGAEERFVGGRRPIAMYRYTSDVCWIQPQLRHCNLYLPRGAELNDPGSDLEGSSDRTLHAKFRDRDEVESAPVREWLRESIRLNEAALGDGLSFDQVLDRLRRIGLALPQTKETLTWGIPHLRVGEKIFCGCAEIHGRPRVGLKMEKAHSEVLMKLSGVEKAPYSRPGDGWVTLDPNVFDDWDEIERLLLESYRLIAPKRVAALVDSPAEKGARPRRRAKRSN